MDIFNEFFEKSGFTPNEETKKMLRDAGNQLAAYLLSAAAMTGIAELVNKGLFSPKTTRIEIDNSVPAEIFAVKNNSRAPAEVFVSSKKRQVNLAPAVFLALLGVFIHVVSSAEENTEGEKIKVDAEN